MRLVHLDTGDLLTASGVMLGAAATLSLLPGHPGLACPFRSLTGVPCPLCGMTTSVVDTLRLDVGSAFSANPAGLAAVVAAACLLVLRPRRLAVPAALIPTCLAAMWAFELHRFGLLI